MYFSLPAPATEGTTRYRELIPVGVMVPCTTGVERLQRMEHQYFTASRMGKRRASLVRSPVVVTELQHMADVHAPYVTIWLHSTLSLNKVKRHSDYPGEQKLKKKKLSGFWIGKLFLNKIRRLSPIWISFFFCVDWTLETILILFNFRFSIKCASWGWFQSVEDSLGCK